jgi:cytochrome P450
MRATCPVAHSDYLGWSVFNHAGVMEVVEDAATYSSAVSAQHPAVPNGYDPPEHGHYRTVIDRYFQSVDMLKLEPLFRTIAHELLDVFPRTDEVEFISRFAQTYALRAERVWLDWPDYTEIALRDWATRNHRATLAGDRSEIAEVARDFDDIVQRVIDERRARPGSPSDITGRLLRETIGGELLTNDEVVAILRNWTVGELGTMSASVGILVEYLATNPNLQDALRRSPEELPAAIDEILRIHAPLLTNRRVTTTAVELSGRTIPAGERITVMWSSANRDEAVFGNPDEYRPHENAAANLLYGRGIHDCPGAPLARVELQAALAVILSETTSIRPVAGTMPERAEYPASGFTTLPLAIEFSSL